MRRVAVSLIALTLASACTQPPARVELRGSDNFAQSNALRSPERAPARSYGRYQPPKPTSGYRPYEPPPVYTNTRPVANVSQSTEQAAGVQSISSSDLPPPSGAKAAPAPASEGSARVNPWTSRPRSAITQEESALPSARPATQQALLAKPAAAEPAKNSKYVHLIKPQQQASRGFMWPVSSRKVVSGFGPKGAGKSNDGINIASAEGEPVWAAADGEVVYASNELGGYGNMVLIKHAGSKSSTYAHLSRAVVDKYDRVKQGDIIGYVGSSGNVSKPQLHFAIRDGKEPVDPRKLLNTTMAGL
jgi:murein DD-endopeptidase MepM/ murein hydrolase activator NlpD